MSVSVVINTKNAEKTLSRAIRSVKFADEVIVVDMNSHDRTKEIAQSFTSKIYSFKDVGYVEPARNFAISKATSDWILILDADEEVSPGLAEFVSTISKIDVNAEEVNDCYFIPRKNVIFGKWIEHTGWWPDYVLRLFKKGRVTWNDQIHAVPKHTGSVKRLPATKEYVLIHHHYQTISEFIDRLNRYTTHQADTNSKTENTRTNIINTFSDELVSRLFAQKGIDDDIHGVILSFLQALYQFTVQAKKLEKSDLKKHHLPQEKTIQSIRSLQQKLNYWIADYNVSHTSGIRCVLWKIRRKLKI